MNRRPSSLLPRGSQDDETPEITGHDATMDEAAIGSAGDGASPYGADLSGGLPTPIQDPPDQPSDIVPDSIVEWPRGEEEERELDAQGSEPKPLDPSKFP